MVMTQLGSAHMGRERRPFTYDSNRLPLSRQAILSASDKNKQPLRGGIRTPPGGIAALTYTRDTPYSFAFLL